MRRVACVAMLAACGGNHAVEDAKRPPPRDDATGSAQPARDASGPVAAGRGDLAVRVEWRDVPVALRSSPGRTPCGRPTPPAVAPTTTWGIPDAVVVTDIGGAFGDTRVVVGECAMSPRVAVGARLVVASAAQTPVKLVLTRRGQMTGAGIQLKDGAATAILLPIAGHEAVVALDANAAYELAGNGDSAWIVSVPASAVTDASGVATFRDLPAGSHGVRVFLPPRGAPVNGGSATATVGGGALTELTIPLAP